jgi:hypothetical protein
MPEDNLVQPSQTQNATTQELPAELKQQMDASINGFVRPSNQIIEQPPPVTQPVTKDNADQIIKLAMQLENPDLTGDEVNYRFNKMFTVPKAPVWDKATEEEEDYNNRKADWQSQVEDVEMNKRIEAKLAKPKLEAAKSKIVFPEIENQVDERVTQYLKMLEDEPKLNEEIKESYKKITPQALETKIKFTDEPNKIDFEFQYVPDGDSFNKAVEIASDWNKIVDHFKKSDGSPDREGFAKAMHFMLNAKSIITEAMNQSKNATLKSMLPNNSGSGLQRQFPQTQELSDLDKQMQLSLNGYGRR